MIRGILPALAVVSLLVFPPLITFVFVVGSALLSPLVGIALGVLSDVLYYPGNGLPFGVISGCGIALVAFFVRRFVKARIML